MVQARQQQQAADPLKPFTIGSLQVSSSIRRECELYTIQSAPKVSAIVVAGVAGSGKTTVGKALAGLLEWDFVDADELHTAHNIGKMSAGVPLTDEDRKPWLDRVRGILDESIDQEKNLVMACSALRRRYVAFLLGHQPRIRLAHLSVDREILVKRLAARRDHFFPLELLASQLEIQEFPPAEQVFDGGRPALEVAREIALRFGPED